MLIDTDSSEAGQEQTHSYPALSAVYSAPGPFCVEESVPGITMGSGHVLRQLLGQGHHQLTLGLWESQVGPNNSVLLKLFPLFKTLHLNFCLDVLIGQRFCPEPLT